MDRSSPYYLQVQLLLQVLPFVFQEPCFALKGGTAINLFVRDFPRLSVDIDLVLLLEHEGITDELRKTFLVYLISHPRPMEELLAPHWQPLETVFASEFKGMVFKEVSLEQLYQAARQVLKILLAQMTKDEQRFLCSIYEGAPDWSALGLAGVGALPAVKWKLNNVARMPAPKRKAAITALRHALGIQQ